MFMVCVFLFMINLVFIIIVIIKILEVVFLFFRLVLLGIICSEKKMNEKIIFVNESFKILCFFFVCIFGIFLLYRCER